MSARVLFKSARAKFALLLATVPLWKLIYGAVDAYFNLESMTQHLPAILAFMGSWWGAIILMAVGFGLLALQIRKQSKPTVNEESEHDRVYMSREEKQLLLDERKTANENYLALKTAHEPCERTIVNLETQVRRLEKADTTQGLLIDVRDRDIANLKEQLSSALQDAEKREAELNRLNQEAETNSVRTTEITADRDALKERVSQLTAYFVARLRSYRDEGSEIMLALVANMRLDPIDKRYVDWNKKVQDFLDLSSPGFAARFRSEGAGYPYIGKTSSNTRQLVDIVHTRVARLQQFINESHE